MKDASENLSFRLSERFSGVPRGKKGAYTIGFSGAKGNFQLLIFTSFYRLFNYFLFQKVFFKQ